MLKCLSSCVSYYLPWEQDSVGCTEQWDLQFPRCSLTPQGLLCVSLVVENEPLGNKSLYSWCPDGWNVNLKEPGFHCSVKSYLWGTTSAEANEAEQGPCICHSVPKARSIPTLGFSCVSWQVSAALYLFSVVLVESDRIWLLSLIPHRSQPNHWLSWLV